MSLSSFSPSQEATTTRINPNSGPLCASHLALSSSCHTSLCYSFTSTCFLVLCAYAYAVPSAYNVLSPPSSSRKTPIHATKPYLTITKLTMNLNPSSTSQVKLVFISSVHHQYLVLTVFVHLSQAYVALYLLRDQRLKAQMPTVARQIMRTYETKPLGCKTTRTSGD